MYMAVREGLLVLLSESERYGYELKTEWELATGGSWTVNVGQIYSTLDRLTRDGLVVERERADAESTNKHYAITAAGREALADWWASTPDEEPIPRDGLVAKILLAIRAQRSGSGSALELVTRHRTALTGSLQRTRRELRGATPSSLARRLAIEARIARTEADLRWLDQCESQLLRPTTDAAGDPT